MDRTSELPEHVLQHILSFLDISQIARAGSVSKTWQNAWQTLTALEFNEAFFDRVEGIDKATDVEEEEAEAEKQWRKRAEKRKVLFDGVEKTLAERRRKRRCINKFTLKIPDVLHPAWISMVDRWIGPVIESNVKELKIETHVWPLHLVECYSLPAIVFGATSIVVLDLTGCKLRLSHGSNVRLISLKKLSLCEIRAEDNSIRILLAGCPLVEDVSFQCCWDLKNLHIHGLHKLARLKVSECHILKHLKIEGSSSLNSLEIGRLSIIARSYIDISSSCRNLKLLKVYDADITEDWLHNFLSRFPLLECLLLHGCEKLQNVKISSGCLKKLDIRERSKGAKFEIDTPCLHSFHYYSSGFGLRSLTLRDFAPSKVELGSRWQRLLSHDHCHVKLIEFLYKFSHCCILLTLRRWTLRDFIIPKELRETMPSPSYNVKELYFQVFPQPKYEKSLAVECVDSLLWIIPHLECLCLQLCCCYTFKFTYGKPPNGGGQTSCCNSFPVLCWQHCITSVKIERFCENNGQKLASYYFDNDIWSNVKGIFGCGHEI